MTIADRLTRFFTPTNDRSGFATMWREYVLIEDGECAWLADADEAAAWLDSATDDDDYNDFCHWVDPIDNEIVAVLCAQECGVHIVTTGGAYVLDDEIREAIDAGREVYEVATRDVCFGLYAGDDASDAIEAMLDDACADGDDRDHGAYVATLID